MIFTTKPPFSFSHVFRISILAFVLICGIALPTHFFAQENVKVLSDGKILINTNTLLGLSDLTLRSKNAIGYGGMYIESPDGLNGKPFYGYGVDGQYSAWHYFDKTTNSWRLNFNGDKLILNSTGQFSIDDRIFLHPNAINSSPQLHLKTNNGVNTVSIRAKGTTTTGSEIRMSNQAGVLNLFLKAENYPGRGASIYVKNHLEASTVQIHGDYNNTGTGRVITEELEIKGGSDLAEYFDSKDKSITPGSVVCIDPDNPGMVLPAGEAYDKKVVGVVSGANGIKPGMMMGQQGSIAFGNVPVAIAGRVYVRVDESNGPVEPGDFLTTSGDGKAMKVTDWDAARGAIVGKALTRADENGYVLALVHLQ